MSREYVIDAGGSNRFRSWDFDGYTEANTFDGKLYYTWLSRSLKVYKDPGLGAADLVAVGSGTTTRATIAMATSNGSGITGTVLWAAVGDGDIPRSDPGHLYVTYAFSADMVMLEKAITSYFPIGGNSHFRDQLEMAKLDVDKIVRRRWGHLLKEDAATGRPDWRGLKDVRELRDAQVYRALFWLFRHKASKADPDQDPHYQKAMDWERMYEEEIRSLTLQLDLDSDNTTDREPAGGLSWRRS